MQTWGKLQCEDATCNYFANLSKIANFRKIKVFFTYCTNLTQKDIKANVKYTNTTFVWESWWQSVENLERYEMLYRYAHNGDSSNYSTIYSKLDSYDETVHND